MYKSTARPSGSSGCSKHRGRTVDVLLRNAGPALTLYSRSVAADAGKRPQATGMVWQRPPDLRPLKTSGSVPVGYWHPTHCCRSKGTQVIEWRQNTPSP
jgi:hypothetical protein